MYPTGHDPSGRGYPPGPGALPPFLTDPSTGSPASLYASYHPAAAGASPFMGSANQGNVIINPQANAFSAQMQMPNFVPGAASVTAGASLINGGAVVPGANHLVNGHGGMFSIPPQVTTGAAANSLSCLFNPMIEGSPIGVRYLTGDPSRLDLQLANDEGIEELQRRLQMLYKKMAKSGSKYKLKKPPKKKRLYCAMWEQDKSFYRAVVEEILPDDLILLKFIDYGNTELCQNWSDFVWELDEEFKSIPAQSLCCVLNDFSADDKWEDDKMSAVNFLLQFQASSGVPLMAVFTPNEHRTQRDPIWTVSLSFVIDVSQYLKFYRIAPKKLEDEPVAKILNSTLQHSSGHIKHESRSEQQPKRSDNIDVPKVRRETPPIAPIEERMLPRTPSPDRNLAKDKVGEWFMRNDNEPIKHRGGSAGRGEPEVLVRPDVILRPEPAVSPDFCDKASVEEVKSKLSDKMDNDKIVSGSDTLPVQAEKCKVGSKSIYESHMENLRNSRDNSKDIIDLNETTKSNQSKKTTAKDQINETTKSNQSRKTTAKESVGEVSNHKNDPERSENLINLSSDSTKVSQSQNSTSKSTRDNSNKQVVKKEIEKSFEQHAAESEKDKSSDQENKVFKFKDFPVDLQTDECFQVMACSNLGPICDSSTNVFASTVLFI